MAGIELRAAERIIPMIYAYSTPEIARHAGHLKIGQAFTQTVEERVRQQGRTVDVLQKVEWKGSAIYDDGSGDVFTDGDFRAYLYKLGYARIEGTEYVQISVPDSRARFQEFRASRGVVADDAFAVSPYTLRAEQQEAVRKTAAYAKAHPGGQFLWNAKPRFGKTLSVYDLVLRMSARRVLIVTNRPAIANAWYEDYAKFIGRANGYFFVSSVDGVRQKPLTLSHEAYEREARARAQDPNAREMGCIEFVSLQDLKGAIAFGGEFQKLAYIARTPWDLLVIDEAHEGVDTYRTDDAFRRIQRGFTLHLSGTPFKALANDTFPDDAIFNWTYADEQAARRAHENADSNPYEDLPRLNMFTYQMSEIVCDELAKGVEIDGEQRAYAFDLNEFFATDGAGRFLHDAAVDEFLYALTTREKFPFSTPALRDEIRHSLWLLSRVDSARSLARKLENHPVFRNYKIVLAAGDGRMDADDQAENARSYDQVRKAIAENAYTITLSVGQLTTGVTVPEWTAVMMLSSLRSPSLYMQAAFRAQNPCLFRRGAEVFRKRNAYVFDFDPARTLIVYDKFANDLMPHGTGDLEERRANIRELLNFFPVLGEDETGRMMELDAEKVLSIPRKLKSEEVVRSGFTSNYLFTDAIGVVFRAPQEVLDIITSFTPAQEPGKRANITPDLTRTLHIGADGEVHVPDDEILARQRKLFGDKVFEPAALDWGQKIPASGANMNRPSRDRLRADLTRDIVDTVVKPVVESVKEDFDGFRKSDQNATRRQLINAAGELVREHEGAYHDEQTRLAEERDSRMAAATRPEERQAAQRAYEQASEANRSAFLAGMEKAVADFEQHAQRDAVREAERSEKQAVKREQEARLRDHLRGFSRTIPSFLMAYGDDAVRLANFDEIIPDDVFREVTGISLEQFRRLRDGGQFDGADGEVHTYAGLFDEVVFDDSVQVFMRKKKELANYFDESHAEDIFDYIPPQRTNQIFTPRWVVRKMMDALETENPGCFEDPAATFADLYMKSGLYITEIVKRLYKSEGLRAAYPNDGERIRHILREQVYGMAPTKIIYRIATNYILGFDDTLRAETKNFVQADAAAAAKSGTLEALVDACFGP